MRRHLAIAGVVVVSVFLALPSLASEPEATFLDEFSTQGYGGNNGTHDFNGPWIEVGEADGPTSGNVWVWDHEYCDGKFCLKMGGEEGGAGRGVYRAVDLTGATSATLRVDYGRELLDDESAGTAVIQVSPDAGATWNTLKTISLDVDDGSLQKDKTFEIDDWATADTRIRFMITEAEGLEAYWLIDNVSVEATFDTTTTTTTSKPPPPTTTSTTTTTKVSASTTTTTKPRETTTTTTKPHKTTTTTSPRETTTTTSTVPRTTTTSTTLPPHPGDDLPPDERDMMMGKTNLAVTSAMPPTAMPASLSEDGSSLTPHAQPVEMIATAFFTESGNYGGNLLPAIGLGLVIAVVSLLGVGSRKKD